MDMLLTLLQSRETDNYIIIKKRKKKLVSFYICLFLITHKWDMISICKKKKKLSTNACNYSMLPSFFLLTSVILWTLLRLGWIRWNRFLYTIYNSFTICCLYGTDWFIFKSILCIWMGWPEIPMGLTGLHCLTVFSFIISDIYKYIVQVFWRRRM